jgi:hypothetical protein
MGKYRQNNTEEHYKQPENISSKQNQQPIKNVKFVEAMITEIMNTSQIRKELHKYIDKGDERFLRLVHAIATNYKSDEDFTLPGPPMDAETYKGRIRNAKERVKAGYYTTQEDLEEEMEQW